MEKKVESWLEENKEKAGIRQFEIEERREGESNHNFILKTEEGKRVLRVSRDISRESRLQNESEKLDFLEEKGIERIPRKIFFDRDTEIGEEVLIETFTGETGLDKDSMNDERLRSLARKIAEIHSIPVKEYNRFAEADEPEARNLKQVFREDFKDWSKRPFNEYLELVDEPDEEIVEYFEKQKKLLDRVPDLEVETGLVHGDLGFNVRATGNKVFIVDWEFSRIDYPRLEILYCFEHEKLDSEQRQVFLEEYRKHRDTGEAFEKIRQLYQKFLAFNDMIWAAKRVEKGEGKHKELLEERLEHLEKLYRED